MNWVDVIAKNRYFALAMKRTISMFACRETFQLVFQQDKDHPNKDQLLPVASCGSVHTTTHTLLL